MRAADSKVRLAKSPESGFLECLFGESTVEESVMIDDKTGLHVLPLTPDRHTPRDVFGSRAFGTDDPCVSWELRVLALGDEMWLGLTHDMAKVKGNQNADETPDSAM